MSAPDEARSWLEAAQRLIGVSVVLAGMVEAFRIERRLPDESASGAAVVDLRGAVGSRVA